MPKFIPKMTDQKEAIEKLSCAGVPVIERAYGFRVTLPPIKDEESSFIECGTEHDGSISLSMPNPKTKRAEWFFRFDFIEASQLVVESFSVLNAGYSTQEFVESMKSVNEQYDRESLVKRLEQQELDFQEYLKKSS